MFNLREGLKNPSKKGGNNKYYVGKYSKSLPKDPYLAQGSQKAKQK